MAELAPQEGHGVTFFQVIEQWRDSLHGGNHSEQMQGAWKAPHFTVFTVELLDHVMAVNALNNVQEIQREFQALLGGKRVPPELRQKGYTRLQAEALSDGTSLDDTFPERCELTLRAGDFLLSDQFPHWFMREFVPVGSSHECPQMRKIEHFVNQIYALIEGPLIVSKFKQGKVVWRPDNANPHKIVLVERESGRKLLRRHRYSEFKWHISAGNAVNLLNGSTARRQSLLDKKAAAEGQRGLYLRTHNKFGAVAPEAMAYLESVQAEMLEAEKEGRKLPFTDWLISPKFLSQNLVTLSLRPSNGEPQIYRKGKLL